MNRRIVVLALASGLVVLFLMSRESQAQVHETNALYKNETRAECFERYGLNPGCGAPLEEWLLQIDRIEACKVNYAKGLQRINETLSRFHGLPEGYEFPEFRFGNIGVTGYVVPQIVAFRDYDAGKYPTLSASFEQHRKSGVDTMVNYIIEVEFNHFFDNWFRALMGQPARPPINPPRFSVLD